jgi:antimicrobial peptide system SdpB family protein
MIPLALTDNRKWHWQKTQKQEKNNSTLFTLKKLTALTTWVALRFQVAIIYFHAATAKFALDEWVDGTILYYWFSDPMAGFPDWLKIFLPIFTTSFLVVFTWSTLILETLLFMALVMPKKYLVFFLGLGVLFHFSIALTMGLISFGFAMTAAIILYLRTFENEFDIKEKKLKRSI